MNLLIIASQFVDKFTTSNLLTSLSVIPWCQTLFIRTLSMVKWVLLKNRWKVYERDHYEERKMEGLPLLAATSHIIILYHKRNIIIESFLLEEYSNINLIGLLVVTKTMLDEFFSIHLEFFWLARTEIGVWLNFFDI